MSEKDEDKSGKKGQIVGMSNALARAGHGLSLAEKRLIALAASQLDSRKPHGTGLLTSRLSAADYAETFDLDANTAYEQLQEGAEHLYQRTITFYKPAKKRRRGEEQEGTRVTMRWVGEVHYQRGEGWLELHWWHRVVPHLTGLQKQFTKYSLAQASALRSMYSWRLLELLTSYQDRGHMEIDIADFREAVDAPPSMIDFGQLRRRVLEPAIKELRDKDGWLIEWEPQKKGRRVAALRFRFRRDPQERLF